MKLISWNVNGLRACVNKNFMEEFQKLDADFSVCRETKLQEGQIDLELPGYEQYWNYAKRKGYSGRRFLQSIRRAVGLPTVWESRSMTRRGV